MNHGSLFSGIGGFDLAAQWCGWNNMFHCDIDEFSRKICSHYWPQAKSYDNIKTTDFTIWRGKIDVLSGGFPCQPFSNAGKRLGKEDERHLWPEMFRAITEIRPRYIVGENVRGLLSWSDGLVLEEVYADLESQGYEVTTFVLPAVGINAPHKRDRVWIVAKDTSSNGRILRESQKERTEVRELRNPSTGSSDRLHIPEGSTTDPMQIRLQQCENTTEVERGSSQIQSQRSQPTDGTQTNGSLRDATNPTSTRRTENNRPRKSRLNDQTCASSNWTDFPTQSPVCSGDDGFSSQLDNITFPKWRKKSLMGYGNAIVPQLAYRIFQTINDESISENS